MSKEKAKSILRKILGGFGSPLVGLIIGIYGIVLGYYAFKVQGNPEGILSFTAGCIVMVVAVLNKITIRLERNIDDLKESLKGATIGIPRYKRDTREPYGPNYMTDLESNVKTK